MVSLRAYQSRADFLPRFAFGETATAPAFFPVWLIDRIEPKLQRQTPSFLGIELMMCPSGTRLMNNFMLKYQITFNAKDEEGAGGSFEFTRRYNCVTGTSEMGGNKICRGAPQTAVITLHNKDTAAAAQQKRKLCHQKRLNRPPGKFAIR